MTLRCSVGKDQAELAQAAHWLSQPCTAAEIRQPVCEVRGAEGLDQETSKDKNKLAELLKPSGIKQAKAQMETIGGKYLPYTVFICKLMLAANPARDRQVASGLSQSTNHMLCLHLTPKEGPSHAPPSLLQCTPPLLLAGPLWKPASSLPCPFHRNKIKWQIPSFPRLSGIN